jgi:hypothetical protein
MVSEPNRSLKKRRFSRRDTFLFAFPGHAKVMIGNVNAIWPV